MESIFTSVSFFNGFVFEDVVDYFLVMTRDNYLRKDTYLGRTEFRDSRVTATILVLQSILS